MKTLVIGLGNPILGDDGVGWVVAEEVRKHFPAGPPVDVEDVGRWQVEMPARQIDKAISHASYLINLASPKEDIWEKSVAAHSVC